MPVKVLKTKGGSKRDAQKVASTADDERKEILNILGAFQIGLTDLDIKRRELRERSGEDSADWIVALELLRDLVTKIADIDLKLKMYQAMTVILAGRGSREDLVTILEIIARINLKSFETIGFNRVEIECKDDACPECMRLKGRKILISDALTSMPLPCRECMKTIEGVDGYCRCRYVATY